jgi:hypothetical protein
VRPAQASISAVRTLGTGTHNHRDIAADRDRLRPKPSARYSHRRPLRPGEAEGAQSGSSAWLASFGTGAQYTSVRAAANATATSVAGGAAVKPIAEKSSDVDPTGLRTHTRREQAGPGSAQRCDVVCDGARANAYDRVDRGWAQERYPVRSDEHVDRGTLSRRVAATSSARAARLGFSGPHVTWTRSRPGSAGGDTRLSGTGTDRALHCGRGRLVERGHPVGVGCVGPHHPGKADRDRTPNLWRGPFRMNRGATRDAFGARTGETDGGVAAP